jgi:hypothetical protein
VILLRGHLGNLSSIQQVRNLNVITLGDSKVMHATSGIPQQGDAQTTGARTTTRGMIRSWK